MDWIGWARCELQNLVTHSEFILLISVLYCPVTGILLSFVLVCYVSKYHVRLNWFVLFCLANQLCLVLYCHFVKGFYSIKPQWTFPRSLRSRNDHLNNFPRGDRPNPRHHALSISIIPQYNISVPLSTVLNILMNKALFNIVWDTYIMGHICVYLSTQKYQLELNLI